MPTPTLQTLVTDAQQVLNLTSISAIRSVVAVSLANANTGTPLNPNLTTQQLWDEFYQVVTQPKSDIESIIANQLMKFLYAPPAPGGVGANGQVIFNDAGTLAGAANLYWNKVNQRLGLGTNTPNYTLDVVGSGYLTGNFTITGDLTVRTNKLAVTSSGVGLGTTSPNSSFQATLSGLYGLQIRSADTNFSNVNIGCDPASGYVFMDSSKSGSGSYLPIRFSTSDLERMRIDTSGNLGLGVTPSAGGGVLQLKSGITFPATQVASSDANTLDDYEEGTFTAGIAFGGGSTGITYSQQTFRYTKIGRVVSVSGYIALTNKGSSTGGATITGLPFVIANSASAYSAPSLWLSAVTPNSGGYVIQANGNINGTALTLTTFKTDGSYTYVTDVQFANNSELIVSFTYTV